jgi:hypothetical protein
MSRDTLSMAVGVGLIVLGVLLILGELTLRPLLNFAGIVLIVLGILVLLKTLPGGLLVGIVALVVGILLLKNILPLPDDFMRASGDAFKIINIVAGAVLVALGIARLSHTKS